MSRNDDQHDAPPITRTEADATSETRFGPRPVPEGHRHPAGPSESRRIPPQGDVSPDGRRVWPRPSPTAKWLVWGGTALAAAAVTAGTVIAARHLLDAVSGPKRRDGPERSMAPRFADLSPEERAAMRRRVRDRDAEDARHFASLRAEAEAGLSGAGAAQDRPRRRPAPRPSLMEEVEANTAGLQNGLENVMQTLNTAVSGFRAVAGQTGSILREFDGAAEMIRGIFACKEAGAASNPRSARQDAPMPDLRDDPLTHDPLAHDPRNGADTEQPTDRNPRLHRL
ncbi:hypothetical protein [Paracoccus lutimaris]|uniref:Uncharacterized protein n=1 Tax=Paracoccus lutimaris TaxID=1490030 RepID=A0A368YK31_9RHOB|nr:hypothetical protein [Paracoccus lutimaris]RCW79676.1 hypothetical protein DFP89_1236 [Paracoccus lutimaris]